jgi:hypothetical protein
LSYFCSHPARETERNHSFTFLNGSPPDLCQPDSATPFALPQELKHHGMGNRLLLCPPGQWGPESPSKDLSTQKIGVRMQLSGKACSVCNRLWVHPQHCQKRKSNVSGLSEPAATGLGLGCQRAGTNLDKIGMQQIPHEKLLLPRSDLLSIFISPMTPPLWHHATTELRSPLSLHDHQELLSGSSRNEASTTLLHLPKCLVLLSELPSHQF